MRPTPTAPWPTCSRSPPSSATRWWPTSPRWAPECRGSRSASAWCSTRGCRAGHVASTRRARRVRRATTACAGTSPRGPSPAGIHTGTCKDAPGGFADYFPAHHSMLYPRARQRARRAGRVRRSLRRVAALDHAPPTAPRWQGARLRRRCARAPRRRPSCAPSTPTSRSWWWRASRPRPTLARRLRRHRGRPRAAQRAHRSRPRRGRAVCCSASTAVCPWRTRARSTSSTTPSASPRPSRSACAS